MIDPFAQPFLRPEDPPPLEVANPGAGGRVVVACDHAGRVLPTVIAAGWRDEAALSRHIAWDIGARDIALRLAERLDAVAVLGTYSRLVADLNRYPSDPALAPEASDGTFLPFNLGLGRAAVQARVEALHRPYHDALAHALDSAAGRAAGAPPVLVSVHTMTDRMSGGTARAEAYAVLHAGRDHGLGPAMLAWLRDHAAGAVGDNTPYALDLDIDFTVPEHAFRRGIPSVMIEVRQDLVAEAGAARRHADVLAEGLLALLPGAAAGRVVHPHA